MESWTEESDEDDILCRSNNTRVIKAVEACDGLSNENREPLDLKEREGGYGDTTIYCARWTVPKKRLPSHQPSITETIYDI